MSGRGALMDIWHLIGRIFVPWSVSRSFQMTRTLTSALQTPFMYLMELPGADDLWPLAVSDGNLLILQWLSPVSEPFINLIRCPIEVSCSSHKVTTWRSDSDVQSTRHAHYLFISQFLHSRVETSQPEGPEGLYEFLFFYLDLICTPVSTVQLVYNT